MNLTWEEVERYRDRTFRRRKSLAVRGEKTAMAFINRVGFCTAFSAHENLPCLWVAVCGRRNPRMPHHTHSDYAVGLTWGLKDSLPDARKVFYAKLLHGKPTLISLEFLPHFYRVFGPQQSGPIPGALSLTEQGILDWLSTHPPQPTFQLRLHADFRGRLQKSRFEKAMARLQQSLLVLKTKTVYEPKFTYYWGLVEKEFPKAVRRARGLSQEAALEKILRKYFDAALCARKRDLSSVFRGVEPGLLNEVLEGMTNAGLLRPGVRIEGKDGAWICGIMVR